MDTETQEQGRNNPPKGHRFKKGQSGNPGGRPRGSVSIVHMIRRALKEKCDQPGANGRTWAELLGKSLIANAIKGNGTAIKEVLSRIDGPIPTVLEGGDPEKPIVVADARDDLLSRIARIAERKRVANDDSGPESRGG